MQQRYLRVYDSFRYSFACGAFLSAGSFEALTTHSLKNSRSLSFEPCRGFTTTTTLSAGHKKAEAAATERSTDRGPVTHESNFENAILQEKEKQIRAPWHRDGSSIPPVMRQRSAGAMTKGIRFPLALSNSA